MVRVVIADDHQMLVDALEATLTGAGMDVVATTVDGAAVVAYTRRVLRCASSAVLK